jgi:ABC-2 type transport system permease protein
VWRRRRRTRATRDESVIRLPRRQFVTNDIGLVVGRELRERLRSRFYVAGTILILLVVASAIVIPVVRHSSSTTKEHVGVVGTLSSQSRSWLVATARLTGATVNFVDEADLAHAQRDVAAGTVDFAVVDGRELVVNTLFATTDVSTTAVLARAMASHLGDVAALDSAHLTPGQLRILAEEHPVPFVAVHHGSTRGVNVTSVIGVILIFIMLSQYNTWILVGVMEEKSSRVVEVLLSTVRPIRLLSGKVFGIGLAALLQASVVVAFALVLSKLVGSSLLHGTGPAQLVSTLVWLVLGYSFYCWAYAAAGSMAERQDQVQSLALPLSLPLIVGYVVSLTAASSTSPSLLLKVLAYVPFTAPFAMTTLVGFSAVSWWQFAISVVITLLCTFAVARLATGIYRRAILRTGSRMRWRDLRAPR